METENNQNNGLSFVGLHDELDIGFCIIEVRFADVAQPSDYRFVEVNAAFEKHTGIQGATGRWMRNLVPDLEQYWFDRYQDIAATGKPAHFEYVAKAMEQRHFDVYAYRIDNPDNPGKYYVAVLFSDISARKKEEARSAALLALSDAFNQLGDTASLTDTASRVLGETLGVQLVGYGIVDAISESLRVENDWTRDGGRSLKGTVHFRDYGSYIEDFKRGETVVVNDARTDPRTRDFAAALEARSARAFVNAPVFERGEFVALLYVSTVHPRNWTPGELTFIRDVALRTRTATARRQAERERRELAASLEGQVLARTRELDRSWQLSQELLVVALPDGTIEAINPMWTTVLGYTPDDLIGKPFVEFTHPDDLASTLAAFAGIAEQPLTDPYSYRFRHQSGAWHWLSWTGAFENGRVYAAGRDLMQERRREKALREAEEVTRLTLDSVGGVGVWSADLQQGEYLCDAAIADLYGVDPVRAAQGVPAAEFLANVDPDDLALLRAEIARSLNSDKDVAFEYRLRHPGGMVRWVLSRWRTHKDEHGQPVRRTGVGIETTSQRNLEEQLRQAQKMEAVGQLTGGLAHDFNNLLAGITGALDLMQIRLRQGKLADIERYMNVAQGAARRAAALTHRLLAFSRRQTLDPKPTNVNHLVAGMEELIRRTIGPEVALEVVGAVGLWPALIDAGQLENALLNLCINARDAMPGGGRITIETANKWLDHAAAKTHELPEGQYLSLCVTDTGTGMTPELVAKVFEPFFTTKPMGEGTGLGLSMIHGFARQSGGEVRIYSEVGQGSTVCVYLPRYYGDIDIDEAGLRSVSEPGNGQGETVLIVDDEPSVRMLVVEVLQDLGYTALEAGDSIAGLKLLQSDARIDLMVTDVGLPGGMNGRQLADAALERRPGLKILFITGYAENSLIGNGHLKPGMQVLTKPFAIDALTARVREMIAG